MKKRFFLTLKGDFQICISVSLTVKKQSIEHSKVKLNMLQTF